ncbi:sigma-E factor negative regulatory protein [Dyella sp.]|jgi:sigma-E factor negative regulatory protein RseA|uniref:sigma-E factor negative regulatory protein n=1 Tax=Dyella sp. TaxID=1869338 RepID=UPI002D7A1D33|nr:sigma-E factor negative regulatory protein [Dyella sp.]HET6431475.1 sigma-E factor negative regulatory protein [Dyella sp.]
MNQVNPEHLSAGMDGELSREELRFLLRRLDHDVSLQKQWDRFHLAGDGLRGQVCVLASPSFAERVMRAVDGEAVSVAVAPRGRRGRQWLRLSAGGAIAASVAVVALMATQPADTGRRGELAAAPAVARADGAAPATEVAATAPAAVPVSLSSTNPFRYSQRASATFGVPGPAGAQADSLLPYEQSLSPYQVKGYRTLQNADGSYLLLIDPTRQPARRAMRESATAH